jgi:hypothetical protein
MRAVTFDDVDLDLDDLLVASVADGSWEGIRSSIARGLAASASRIVVAPDDLAEARSAFRRARGLLAADDLKTWLSARSVTLEEWRSHILLMALAASDPRTEVDADPDDASDGGRARAAAAVAVRVEDFLGPAAHTLLLGAASPHRAGPMHEDREVELLIERVASEPALPLLDPSEDRIREHAATVTLLRRQLDMARDEIDEHDMLEAIQANLVDWTEFDYDELILPTESSAREAALCVRVDGSDLAAVGELAGAVPHRHQHTSSTAGPTGAFLVGAVVGEAVGPIESSDGWRVAVLRDRRPPDSDDASTRARARDEVLERSLGRRLAGRVIWHVIC